ncbi:hypothetical protein BDW60DRAFT_175163 [Aspergillus nidulans var. acristatus]
MRAAKMACLGHGNGYLQRSYRAAACTPGLDQSAFFRYGVGGRSSWVMQRPRSFHVPGNGSLGEHAGDHRPYGYRTWDLSRGQPRYGPEEEPGLSTAQPPSVISRDAVILVGPGPFMKLSCSWDGMGCGGVWTGVWSGLECRWQGRSRWTVA